MQYIKTTLIQYVYSFRLSLVADSASENPAFDIYAIHSSTITDRTRGQAHGQESIPKLVVQGIPVKNVQFTNSGMFVRSGVPMDTEYGVHREEGQGWFVQVQRFAWIDKQKVDVEVSDSVPQEEQAALIADGAQVNEKAQPEDINQAMEIDEVPAKPADTDQDDTNKNKASVSSETVVSPSDIASGLEVVLDEVASGGGKGEITDIPITTQPATNGASTDLVDAPTLESKVEGALPTGPKSPATTDFKTIEPQHEPTVDEIIAVKLEIGNEWEARDMEPLTVTTDEIRQNEGIGKQDVKAEEMIGGDLQKA